MMDSGTSDSAKVDVDSDCEIIEEKLVQPARAEPKSVNVVESSTRMSNGDAPTSSSYAFGQPNRKHHASEVFIDLIDIDDEDVNSDLGSAWKTVSVKSNHGSTKPVMLASSTSGSSGEEEPQPKMRRLYSDRSNDVSIGIELLNKSASHGFLTTGNGLTAGFSRRFFRPIIEYCQRFNKHMDAFNRQIWRHFSENLQNDKTFTWKMRIRFLLHQSISQIYKDSHLIAVGSTINGCGAYNSDMDLCLCIRDMPTSERRFAISTLRKIQRRLSGEKFVRRCITIPAKVPILKLWFHPPYEALEVDLNFNNTAGIYNSYLLHYYSRVDDRFSSLCLLIKHWAKLAGIGDAFNGTFNSYSLILMVVHFLQVVCDPPVLPNLQKLYPEVFTANLRIDQMRLFEDFPTPLNMNPLNEQTIGELLMGFFKYYAEFDYDEYAISIANACVFSRDLLCDSTRRFKIFIEEPFDQQNTARCITSADCWERIHEALQKAAGLFTKGAGPPDLNVFLAQFSVKREDDW